MEGQEGKSLGAEINMGGWLRLYRKMKEWEWYTESYMVHLFIHLLISAYYEDTKYKGINYKRGQVSIGRKKLSIVTGISEQKIRTGLGRLKESGEITTTSTSKFTIVTICNYDQYQCDQQVKQPTDNQQITSKQPTDNQQITTVKEDKKKKNVKKLKNNKAIRPESFSEKEFDNLLLHRKSMKAPLTQLALDGLVCQFDKSCLSVSDCIQEMANRGWRGFKAEWVGGNRGGGGSDDSERFNF